MKTKTTFLSSALAVLLLVLATTQSYAAVNYTISFTASGATTSVGSVLVQNITKGTTVTVPSGNTLTLTDQPAAIDALSASADGIRISQNASTGKSTLTFYANQSGSAQIAAYALDGRKVVELASSLEVGDNSLELSLPAGMYVIHVSGTGYAYSTKLQSRGSFVAQAEIKFLSNTKVEASTPLKSKAASIATTMSFSANNILVYTATSGTYIASVPDTPYGTKTINFNFATIPTSAIPEGTFTMGSFIYDPNKMNDEVEHVVTLTTFRISKYEITNAQYAAFLNAKSVGSTGIWAAAPTYPTQILIHASSGDYDFGLHFVGSKWVPVTGFENAPVVFVTWYGAAEYAKYVGGALPTESQWEYACRARYVTCFSTGGYLTNLQANYEWSMPITGSVNTVKIALNKTQAVGSYPANDYGLYDMHGNALEWCADWYGDYPTTTQTNPTGATTGTERCIRGGGWANSAAACRSACRWKDVPTQNMSDTSFRVVFP